MRLFADSSGKPSANFDQWVAMPTRYVMKKVKMCSNKPNPDVVSEAIRSSLRGNKN